MNTPRQRVLVVGGSGFIGQAVVRRLRERGTPVVATYCRAAGIAAQPDVEWVRWDARDAAVPDVAWDTVAALVHLAIPPKPYDTPEKDAELYAVIVNSAARLLERARAAGVERVLLASAGDVLEDRGGPAREDDIDYRPHDYYATCKACAELLFRGQGRVLSTAVLRFFHAYGPGGDRYLVNRLVRAVANGQEVCVEGRAGILLNPVWIDDLAEGVCQAIDSRSPGIFHLAGRELLTLRSLLDRIEKLTGRSAVVRRMSAVRAHQHAGQILRSAKILGFEPRTTLDDGLRQVAGGLG